MYNHGEQCKAELWATQFACYLGFHVVKEGKGTECMQGFGACTSLTEQET